LMSILNSPLKFPKKILNLIVLYIIFLGQVFIPIKVSPGSGVHVVI
jgi:hypothetical protein